ncbi:MAG: chemotaxis protein CheW [Acidobacteria bacterium]|jgi:purine-binding chemotaxis protein CheW|nr:chemotaxis protein CheW [Acidobacteriota bacterium]
MSELRQLVTFRVGRHLLGVDIEEVQEVLTAHDISAVPLAPQEVEGLLNLRGRIVTAIDLRRRLGLQARSDRQAPMVVVLRPERGSVSLLADAVGDVVEVGTEDFEDPPETLRGRSRQLIRGAYKLPRRLLLLLELDRVLDIAVGGQE